MAVKFLNLRDPIKADTRLIPRPISPQLQVHSVDSKARYSDSLTDSEVAAAYFLLLHSHNSHGLTRVMASPR